MLVLITGGVRSGKSSFAEKLLHRLNSNDKIYLATAVPYDNEMEDRISHHRSLRRDKGFRTVEQQYDIGTAAGKISKNSTVLFECIGTLLGNEMSSRFETGSSYDGVYESVLSGIIKINERSENLVIVSNEVFSEGIVYDDMTNRYIEIMGRLHVEIAKHADVVVECVYGLNIYYKGETLLKHILQNH